MNNDGWGFLGAGTSDNRLAGEDLQHNRQTRTDGGPMKYELEREEARHKEGMEHHRRHLEKHHSRHFDSQYGHDTHKYGG